MRGHPLGTQQQLSYVEPLISHVDRRGKESKEERINVVAEKWWPSTILFSQWLIYFLCIFQWISCINSLAAYSSQNDFKLQPGVIYRHVVSSYLNRKSNVAFYFDCVNQQRHARNLTHLQGNQRGGGFLVVHREKKGFFFFKSENEGKDFGQCIVSRHAHHLLVVHVEPSCFYFDVKGGSSSLDTQKQ